GAVTVSTTRNLDDLELELRKLPGVRAAGFTERDDLLVVQVQVAGGTPPTCGRWRVRWRGARRRRLSPSRRRGSRTATPTSPSRSRWSAGGPSRYRARRPRTRRGALGARGGTGRAGRGRGAGRADVGHHGPRRPCRTAPAAWRPRRAR